MITPQQPRNLQVKPKWQLPVGVMEGIVAYNCRKYGFPRPVMVMPMWEGAGNRAIDLSGHGNHGEFNGTDWVANGIYFDGASEDHLNCGSGISLTTLTRLSVYVLARQDTIGSGANVFINQSSSGTAKFQAASISNDELRFYSEDLSPTSISTNTSPLSTDVLNNIVFVWDGSNIVFYVNGVGVYFDTMTGTIDTSSEDLFIGKYKGTGYALDGKMYTAAIFYTDLNAQQVKLLSNNPHFMYQIPEELYDYVAPLPSVSGLGEYFARREQWRGIAV